MSCPIRPPDVVLHVGDGHRDGRRSLLARLLRARIVQVCGIVEREVDAVQPGGLRIRLDKVAPVAVELAAVHDHRVAVEELGVVEGDEQVGRVVGVGPLPDGVRRPDGRDAVLVLQPHLLNVGAVADELQDVALEEGAVLVLA